MRAVRMWLRLELGRRWRSLAVLTLLVALSAGVVMTALAGARRGSSALERLSEPTLPATSAILANTPGFDWAPVRTLPEVESLTTFVVDYTWAVEGLPGDVLGFPVADDSVMRTIEKPVVLAGRVFDPTRADEVVVSRQFVRQHGKGVGDTVVIDLPTPKELTGVEPGPNGLVLHGPKVKARIVGVIASPWFSDNPGGQGLLQPSPGLVAAYPANILGDQKNPENFSYVNALVRLKGGEAAIPAFRAHFDQLTGRPDIDVWNLPSQQRDIQRHITFESRCLVAFGLAALIAALFLVGQAIVRLAAGSAQELQTLRALGMSPLQAVVSAAGSPALVGVLGGLLGAAASAVASYWFPINSASYYEPSPGLRPDWSVMVAGVPMVALLVTAGAAVAAWLALGAARRPATRRSAVALLLARAGAGVPVLIGTRFALEPGRGRTAVPVRPALIGAVTGVVGVIAAFTFAHGVSDAASHPERFGQTFQRAAFIGIGGQDFGPVAKVYQALQAAPQTSGVDDARIAVATGPDDRTSMSLWEYSGGPKPIPVVLSRGRMPMTAAEVVLAPRTLAALDKKVGDTVTLTSTKDPLTLTITGEGMVPAGPHNSYADGGWVTTAGFDSLFEGYKYRIELVTIRPGLDVAAASEAIRKSVLAAVPEAKDLTLDAPDPLVEAAVLKQVQHLPIALGAFLALLALGAVGHALATAVRRRSLDIAVLRALGLTRWQSAGTVVVQATVLAVFGLAFGVPLGMAIGRLVWRGVADYTPLQYVSPLASVALLLIGPLALLTANLLAAWPGRRAAVLRVAHVLRTE